MENEKQSYRLLQIYEILMRGGSVKKEKLAEKFGVSEKTIQRDIESLRTFFSGKGLEEVVYDRNTGEYVLKEENSELLTQQEILGVCKILVERKALFSQINSGEKRFVIASTQKLGTGANVQERLKAVHHVDISWVPSALERASVKA
jgi:predicted DNA-binding transcriptional regulator YafY